MSRVENALNELRQGNILILTDPDDREQEGDLVLAADKVSSTAINFMTRYGRGLICLTLHEEILDRLQIPLMPPRNKTIHHAAFSMSIDAVNGITTGISTHDRAHTIRVAIDPTSTPTDITIPGHIFPLRAKLGGTLERPGHTEGSVDLTILAGLTPAAVICEVLNEDGTMARLSELQKFAMQHKLQILSIDDIIHYRLKRGENKINENVTSDWLNASANPIQPNSLTD